MLQPQYRLFTATYGLLFLLFASSLLPSCKGKVVPKAKEIVKSPEDIDKKTSEFISQALIYALDNSGKLDDSITLYSPVVTKYLYDQLQGKLVWSSKEKWNTLADSLYDFIGQSRVYGLFPANYHYRQLSAIRTRIANDSLLKEDRKDAVLWGKAGMMLTDAFVSVLHDIKLGRLPNDSITLRKDTSLSHESYLQHLNEYLQKGSIGPIVQTLEPNNPDYRDLKIALQNFLDSAIFEHRTFVPYPFKDSMVFVKKLLNRLNEEDSIVKNPDAPCDSMQLSKFISTYQRKKKLTVDGKFGRQVLNALDNNDEEKFIRIAISLDRYKKLPQEMPEKYIWVNLPGYYLQLRVGDTVLIQSKIICGKPATRTPVLNSSIYNIVTYPQWTIPNSIILKEILPGLQKSPGYLAKKGYLLLDKNNNEVDPFTVAWSKYHKGIPYKVIQGSGDDNALGVLKFNFSNKYAVYLHDTNQRYLFARSVRSLSHGCVRVQNWDQLAYYMLDNDSSAVLGARGKYLPVDSLNAWLARKEKHVVPVRNRIPIYIRYITGEGRDGKVVFYDDVYGEDRRLRARYINED
jgi:murein L,D-transpeptidase YcbB/YkuD